MSKVIGKRWIVFQGNECQVDVTCCEDFKWKMEHLLSLDNYVRKINDIMNPQSNGYINIVVVGNDDKIKLNYCSVCGDKYKKEINVK